jgi:hypothetical protein
MLEVAVLVGVEMELSQPLAQDVVFLEPSPQHGKIVLNVQSGNVITAAADIRRGVLQEINDLAFSRGRTTDQDENVESVMIHRGKVALPLFSGKRKKHLNTKVMKEREVKPMKKGHFSPLRHFAVSHRRAASVRLSWRPGQGGTNGVSFVLRLFTYEKTEP